MKIDGVSLPGREKQAGLEPGTLLMKIVGKSQRSLVVETINDFVDRTIGQQAITIHDSLGDDIYIIHDTDESITIQHGIDIADREIFTLAKSLSPITFSDPKPTGVTIANDDLGLIYGALMLAASFSSDRGHRDQAREYHRIAEIFDDIRMEKDNYKLIAE